MFKSQNFPGGFAPLNLNQGSTIDLLRRLHHLRLPPAFFDNFMIIFHEIEHSKTDISKSAWINACMGFAALMLFTQQAFIHNVYFSFNSFRYLRLLFFRIKSQPGVAYKSDAYVPI